MALLWVDGFEQYGAQGGELSPNSVLLTKYNGTSTANINIAAGRNAGDSLMIDATAQQIATPLLTMNDTLIAGVAFKLNNVTGNKCIMDFAVSLLDGDPISYGEMGVWAETQNLAIKMGNSTLNSVNVALSANTWYYLEFKVFSDNASGTAEIRLDGNTVVTYSGDTQYATYFQPYVQVAFRGFNLGVLHLDDFYVCDRSGNTCNDFLGDCTVYTLLPDGDASGNMSASSGTDEYAMVNGTTLNTSNYIKDTASGNRCVFTYGDLPVTPNTVYGVQVVSEANLTGNLTKGLKNVTQNGTGSVNTSSPGRPVTRATTYLGTVWDVYEKNAGGNTWTPALVNDARFGVEVV